MAPLDKAKLELVGAYAVNSLFWMYLNVKGENPKEHPVKQELDRIRSYMTRVKDIQDKELAPKLNKDASKRFVRNALWQQAQKQSHKTSDASNSDTSTAAEPPTSSSKQTDHKRKHKSETQGEKRRKGGSRYHYERTKQTYERKFTV